MALNAVQSAAIDYVLSVAKDLSGRAEAEITRRLKSAARPLSTTDLIEGFRSHTRITLNFHPDRLLKDGSTVAECLLRDGVYRSQFLTGISNGGLTAFAGGDRDRWEERLFGGAYQHPKATLTDRPVYGAVDLHHFSDGAAPRFGSAYLILQPHVLERTTLSAGDSHLETTAFSANAELRPLLAELLKRADETGVILGRTGVSVGSLVDLLLCRSGPSIQGRIMDDYIEAHIHGGVRLAADVAGLTADPSFKATVTGDTLAALAESHGWPLSWHGGSVVQPQDIPDDLRGPQVPLLAERVIRDFGEGNHGVDAAMIGRAARSVILDPSTWTDLGPPADVLQLLKYLWHATVICGSAAEP